MLLFRVSCLLSVETASSLQLMVSSVTVFALDVSADSVRASWDASGSARPAVLCRRHCLCFLRKSHQKPRPLRSQHGEIFHFNRRFHFDLKSGCMVGVCLSD